MTKIWKYILLVFSLFLVLHTWTGVSANSIESGIVTKQTSDMQTPDSSSGCFSINDEVCEDEQIHRVTSITFFVDSIISIANPRINDLIFKTCFIPWQPPKI